MKVYIVYEDSPLGCCIYGAFKNEKDAKEFAGENGSIAVKELR